MTGATESPLRPEGLAKHRGHIEDTQQQAVSYKLPIEHSLCPRSGSQLHLVEIAPLNMAVEHDGIAARGDEPVQVRAEGRQPVGALNQNITWGNGRMRDGGVGSQHALGSGL